MDRVGPLGTLLILAAKPHQKSCTNVDQFVLILCVSYRTLNGVTRSFEFPIPRCCDSIENLGDSYGKLYFISLDARSGYHQIGVREFDQENLAFFTPEVKKKLFVIMPFRPKNTPALIRS